jgi:hypothetical protein
MTADSRTPTKTARMSSDKKDREALKTKLEMCIHPLKPEDHPEQIVNVANGILGASLVNVDRAVSIGHSQLLDLEKELPTGFWRERLKPWQLQRKE